MGNWVDWNGGRLLLDNFMFGTQYLMRGSTGYFDSPVTFAQFQAYELAANFPSVPTTTLTPSHPFSLSCAAGILLGVAIRTKKPLAVPLAPFVWKLLANMSLGLDDLEETDALFTQSLRYVRELSDDIPEETLNEV